MKNTDVLFSAVAGGAIGGLLAAEAGDKVAHEMRYDRAVRQAERYGGPVPGYVPYYSTADYLGQLTLTVLLFAVAAFVGLVILFAIIIGIELGFAYWMIGLALGGVVFTVGICNIDKLINPRRPVVPAPVPVKPGVQPYFAED